MVAVVGYQFGDELVVGAFGGLDLNGIGALAECFFVVAILVFIVSGGAGHDEAAAFEWFSAEVSVIRGIGGIVLVEGGFADVEEEFTQGYVVEELTLFVAIGCFEGDFEVEVQVLFLCLGDFGFCVSKIEFGESESKDGIVDDLVGVGGIEFEASDQGGIGFSGCVLKAANQCEATELHTDGVEDAFGGELIVKIEVGQSERVVGDVLGLVFGDHCFYHIGTEGDGRSQQGAEADGTSAFSPVRQRRHGLCFDPVIGDDIGLFLNNHFSVLAGGGHPILSRFTSGEKQDCGNKGGSVHGVWS